MVLMLAVLKGLWPRLDCQRDRVAAGRKVPEMHICTKIKRIPSTYKGGGGQHSYSFTQTPFLCSFTEGTDMSC